MDFDALLRGGALSLLALLSGVLWRAGGVQRLLAQSCLCGCAFLIVSFPPFSQALGATRWPLTAIAATGPLWFWIATRRAFGDPARSGLAAHTSIATVLAALALAPNLATGGARVALSVTADVALLALFAASLYAAWRGLGDDLDPQRRSLRLTLLGASAGFCVLVATGALWANAVGAGHAALSTAVSVGVLAVTWVYCLLTLKSAAPATPARLGNKVDPLLTKRIIAAFETDKLHRHPDLTLSALAQTLQAPEHQLRAAINADLGGRNFSAFVNAYRLDEVKRALADPTQSDVPIATIALDAGFGSIASFNRTFKAEMGISPSEFRRTGGVT